MGTVSQERTVLTAMLDVRLVLGQQTTSALLVMERFYCTLRLLLPVVWTALRLGTLWVHHHAVSLAIRTVPLALHLRLSVLVAHHSQTITCQRQTHAFPVQACSTISWMAPFANNATQIA